MENLKKSLKYLQWRSSLESNGITIKEIEEIHSVHKKNGELLFSLIKLDATDSEGVKLLPMVLLRGHFVSVVTVLIDRITKEKFFLLVKQRRVANGDIFYEHPAGMSDSETDSIKVAQKEVEEETGLIIKREDIKPLYEKPLYSSPGLLDEAGYFFYCEIEMSSEEIQLFENKKTGAKDENEHINTFLCPVNEVMKYIINSNGILASLLYLEKARISEYTKKLKTLS